MTKKTVLLIALSSGFFAVLLGAFGAHALKSFTPAASLETWKTASFYHFIHTLVLLFIALRQNASSFLQASQFSRISIAFIVGTVLFSGSLYAYVISGFKPLVFATPIGGLCLLAAWFYWFVCELID